MTGSARLQIDLPEGWQPVELDPTVPSEQVMRLGSAGGFTAAVATAAREVATWLGERGAGIALFRPADEMVPVSICGGLFIRDALPISGDVLFAALDAEGEPVALGDLDGVPVVAHIRRDDESAPLPMLRVSYFLCAPGTCIVVIFVAPESIDEKCVVHEVAKIISAARVVHSDEGCPE